MRANLIYVIIDSAVTCCLARDALGCKNVLAVSMPGPYPFKGSLEDSKVLVKNLNIGFKIIPITGIYSSYLESLKDHFAGTKEGIAEENIQARIRGNIVMALSNKSGYLVLSTGNKSELAVEGALCRVKTIYELAENSVRQHIKGGEDHASF